MFCREWLHYCIIVPLWASSPLMLAGWMARFFIVWRDETWLKYVSRNRSLPWHVLARSRFSLPPAQWSFVCNFKGWPQIPHLCIYPLHIEWWGSIPLAWPRQKLPPSYSAIYFVRNSFFIMKGDFDIFVSREGWLSSNGVWPIPPSLLLGSKCK